MQPLEDGEKAQTQRNYNEPGNWTLTPTVRHRIIMCGIGAAIIGVSTFVVSGFRTQKIEISLAGLAFASLGGFLIATSLTLQLVLTPEHLVVRALWRNQWSLPRRSVEMRELTAGPGGPLSGLAIIDIEGGEVIRQIPTGQFSASDLRRLADIFAPRG